MRATPDFDFGLGDTAEMIRETVARFADEQVAPRAEATDREDKFPRDLWPQMGELGLHGITVPEADGGLGLGYRWYRDGANPFGLLATVEAGPAFLRPACGPDVPVDAAPVERRWLGGGSMSFTVGF